MEGSTLFTGNLTHTNLVRHFSCDVKTKLLLAFSQCNWGYFAKTKSHKDRGLGKSNANVFVGSSPAGVGAVGRVAIRASAW